VFVTHAQLHGLASLVARAWVRECVGAWMERSRSHNSPRDAHAQSTNTFISLVATVDARASCSVHQCIGCKGCLGNAIKGLTDSLSPSVKSGRVRWHIRCDVSTRLL
jgi:hypothetical protein